MFRDRRYFSEIDVCKNMHLLCILGDACCGTTAYTDDDNTMCCGGIVVSQHINTMCCGGVVLSTVATTCCNGVSFATLSGYDCCGTSYEPENSTLCCVARNGIEQVSLFLYTVRESGY